MGADGTMMLPLHSYGGVIVQLIRLPAVSQKFSLPFENGTEDSGQGSGDPEAGNFSGLVRFGMLWVLS